MFIFLTWHLKNKVLNSDKIADVIAEKIVNRYQNHIKLNLNKYVYSNKRTGLVYISEKPLIENTYFLQKDGKSICFSVGTPTGISKLFANHNIEDSKTNQLLKLKELFDKNGFGLIKQISSPFIFGFIDIAKDSINIVHDGLGFEQGFIYEDDNLWICSNRCWPIIAFSGKQFSIDDSAWKYYFEIGYFPLWHTSFKEISIMGKGEMWRCSYGNISNEMVDCFREWLIPFDANKGNILEFSRISFNEAVKELIERYSEGKVIADLSGGRDTRMILSSILNQKIDCIFHTVGDAYSADVKVVNMLEGKYSLNIQYKNQCLDKIDEPQLCTKITKFIEWQDGFGDIKSSKYINISPANVSLPPHLSGLVGGIYRGGEYPENGLNKRLQNGMKPILKRIMRKKQKAVPSRNGLDDVKKSVSQEGSKYGLSGYSLIDYYNLAEKNRRWGGANAAVSYAGFLLPFLNIGLIKAIFSLSEKDRIAEIMHKYIIATNSEGLEKIPFNTDLVSIDKKMTKTPYDENVFWRSNAGRSVMEKILNEDHYIWHSFLNKGDVNRMWIDNYGGKARHGEFFWKVAAFYFWCDQFSPHLNGR